MVKHGQPWSIITLWRRLSQYENQPWSIVINQDCFKFYNIYLRVYIFWVYDINPLGLILFPWVFSIDPLGL